MTDGVITVDAKGEIVFMNTAAERLTGWESSEAFQMPCSKVFRIVNAAWPRGDWDPLQAAMEDDEQYSLLPESRLVGKDGIEVPIEDSIAPEHDAEGRVSGATVVFRDVSFTRMMLFKAMHRAHHDLLTNLPNRALLEDRIEQALSSLQRREHRIAVLFIDLDQFKEVNDNYGHAFGDSVLRVVAKRLTAVARPSDTVCRLGGDEFILLLTESTGTDEIHSTVDKVLATVQAPIAIEGIPIQISASVGVVIREEAPYSADALLKDADAAMYRSKRAGGARAHLFEPGTDQEGRKQLGIEQELEWAVENNEFLLHYQPQVNLRTGEIVGVEALLRWNNPRQGMMQPSQFVAVAERTLHILPIGRWVLREAGRQQRDWSAKGLSHLLVSANVSPVELQSATYLEDLDTLVNAGEVDPRSMLLELTESVLLSQTELEVPLFSGLRRMGMKTGIDDFGVGYSSLSYLRRFPLDVIKIDKSFIAECTASEQDAALVKAIVSMGRSLRKTVIAEGVETIEQLAFLQDLGCDQAQGFLFSPALPAEELTDLMQRQRYFF